MNKKVSMILPTINGERYLRSSIDSCLNQTYSPIELIVVDGGSTDSTLKILSGYTDADSRVSVYHQPANSGRLPGALNIGFTHSEGEYLTWMQDDDLYEPNAIENLACFLDAHLDVDFVYAPFNFIDGDGKLIKPSQLSSPGQLKETNSVGHYFLYRRKVYESIGDYNPDFIMSEDVEYWVRVFLKHKMEYYFNSSPLYSHRLHSGSLTIKSYGQFLSLRVAAKARKKWLKISWSDYHRQIADSYIQETFSSFNNQDIPHLRKSLLSGLANNPFWILNRGVASLFVKHVLLSPLSSIARQSKP